MSKVAPNGLNSLQKGDNKPLLTQASIAQGLYENWVEVEVQTGTPAVQVSLAGIPTDLSKFNTPPAGSSTKPLDLGPYAASSVTALFAALRASLCDGQEVGNALSSSLTSQGSPGNQPAPPLPTSVTTSPVGQPTQIGTGPGGIPITITIINNPLNPVLIGGGGLKPVLTNQVSAGVWQTYQIVQTFRKNNNTLHLPMSFDNLQNFPGGLPSTIVTLGQPHVQKTVKFRATALGAPPIIPDFHDPNTTNVVPLRSVIETEEPKSIQGGALQYTISGVYEFAVLDPTQQPVLFGVPPWLNAAAVRFTLTQDLLSQTIANPIGNVANAVTLTP